MSRLDRLRERFDDAGVDSLLVSSGPNVRYLTGFSGSSSAVYVGRDEAILFTDSRYTLQARDEVAGASVRTITGPPMLAARGAANGARRLGIEAGHMTVATYEAVRAGGRAPALVATWGLVEGLRAVKDEAEVGAIESSVRLNSMAFEKALPAIRAGAAEVEVAAAIEHAMRTMGADGPAFESIVASGPRGAQPHARASSRRIRGGEPVVIDIGAMLGGYASDMTRTVFVGEPDERGVRVYTAVLEGLRRAQSAVRAGARAADVDAAARAAVAEAGFAGEAYQHGTGHGVGLEVHEAPGVGRGSDGILAAGMVVTIEPGVYVPDWGGVRIEDVVLVEEAGCRVLTETPKEILTV